MILIVFLWFFNQCFQIVDNFIFLSSINIKLQAWSSRFQNTESRFSSRIFNSTFFKLMDFIISSLKLTDSRQTENYDSSSLELYRTVRYCTIPYRSFRFQSYLRNISTHPTVCRSDLILYFACYRSYRMLVW